jgi:hypothetical protein
MKSPNQQRTKRVFNLEKSLSQSLFHVHQNSLVIVKIKKRDPNQLKNHLSTQEKPTKAKYLLGGEASLMSLEIKIPKKL